MTQRHSHLPHTHSLGSDCSIFSFPLFLCLMTSQLRWSTRCRRFGCASVTPAITSTRSPSSSTLLPLRLTTSVEVDSRAYFRPSPPVRADSSSATHLTRRAPTASVSSSTVASSRALHSKWKSSLHHSSPHPFSLLGLSFLRRASSQAHPNCCEW